MNNAKHAIRQELKMTDVPKRNEDEFANTTQNKEVTNAQKTKTDDLFAYVSRSPLFVSLGLAIAVCVIAYLLSATTQV